MTASTLEAVIPAQPGIQWLAMDSRLRGNDEKDLDLLTENDTV
jgi:hypothetical protein